MPRCSSTWAAMRSMRAFTPGSMVSTDWAGAAAQASETMVTTANAGNLSNIFIAPISFLVSCKTVSHQNISLERGAIGWAVAGWPNAAQFPTDLEAEWSD